MDSAILLAETVGKLAKLSCQRTGDLAQLRMLGEALGGHCTPAANPEDLKGKRVCHVNTAINLYFSTPYLITSFQFVLKIIFEDEVMPLSEAAVQDAEASISAAPPRASR